MEPTPPNPPKPKPEPDNDMLKLAHHALAQFVQVGYLPSTDDERWLLTVQAMAEFMQRHKLTHIYNWGAIPGSIRHSMKLATAGHTLF